jgi:uncharacterized protein (DUF427 family)
VSGWKGLSSYFEKALEHPSGQKLVEFYTQTDKQIRDIHNEARRLADLKQKHPTTAESATAPAEAAAEPANPKA